MKKRLFLLMMAAMLPLGLMAQYNASHHVDSTLHKCDSYTWNKTGETYTTSGVHTALIGDTLFILDLTIHPSFDITVPEVIHGGCSYTWGNMVLTTDGDTSQTFQTVHGCDSTVHITLLFSHQAVKGYTVTACESYTWKGLTFDHDSTVIYNSHEMENHDELYDDETHATICDSLLTLYLTILEPTQIEHDVYLSGCERVNYYFHPNQASITIRRDTVLYSESTFRPQDNWARTTFHPRTAAKCFDSVIYAHITVKKNVVENLTLHGCDFYVYETNDTIIRYVYTQKDSLFLGKAANGCDSSTKIDITISPKPLVYIDGDLRVLPNHTATLTAYSDQEVNYTWDYNGSHDSTITTEPLTQNTNVSLSAASIENGCVAVAHVTVLVTTEGINGTEQSEIRIYPNPTSDFVNINADMAVSHVTVYNFNGQEVMNVNNSSKVNLSNLSNGSYILRIELENGSVATATVVRK